MKTVRAFWKKDPGLFVSCVAHVAVLIFIVANFAHAPNIAPMQESVPVEVMSSSDLNEITSGEKTAKEMPKPQRRVDRIAELEDHKALPPTPEARKDTPAQPSPEKANDDPGSDEKTSEKVAAPPPPPPRPVAKPEPPAPTPPQRPVEAKASPEPKPDTPDAEALDKKDVKPPKKVVKEEPPVPPKRPDPPKKTEPKEARKVEPKKTEPKKETLDQLAKLLDEVKPPKPVTKARAGNEARDAKHSDFSLDKISALLDHDAPQRKASTGRQMASLASLGAPDAHAEKLSPSKMAQIDGWLIDHYRGCWTYFGLGAAQNYVPRVRVHLAPDGTLIGTPALLNPPSDPNLQSLADSALRAANKCNPMPIPDWFKAHYDAWRDRTVRFDPKELS